MKTINSRSISVCAMLALLMLALPCRAFAQQIDSSAQRQVSAAALQFHLLGGLGVSYIFPSAQSGHLRIGVDVSLSHSNQSGDNEAYSTYASMPDGTTSGSASLSQKDQKSTGYQISLSCVYLQKVVGYANTNLFCGIGPVVSYSYYRSTSSYATTVDPTTHISTSNASENTQRTWGAGPIAIVQARSRLIEHIFLSAEVSLSASYQSTSTTEAFKGLSVYSTTSTTSQTSGFISHLKGWAVSLSDIRVGIIVDL